MYIDIRRNWEVLYWSSLAGPVWIGNHTHRWIGLKMHTGLLMLFFEKLMLNLRGLQLFSKAWDGKNLRDTH